MAQCTNLRKLRRAWSVQQPQVSSLTVFSVEFTSELSGAQLRNSSLLRRGDAHQDEDRGRNRRRLDGFADEQP